MSDELDAGIAASPVKRPGRPKLHDARLRFLLDAAVTVLKQRAREGLVPRNITSDRAACTYIAEHPDGAAIRAELGLPERTSGASLAIRLSEGRRRDGLVRRSRREIT